MKKFLSFISIIVIAFLFLSTISFATNIDMNLQANETSQSTVVSSSGVDSLVTEEALSFSNILTILLLVVGFVIILLGIAVLVRTKY